MRLLFLTSIASSRSAYAEGRVIEVPHLTPEFATWRDAGIVQVLDAEERAEAIPVMETPEGRPFRPSRRGGRGQRLPVSPLVPA